MITVCVPSERSDSTGRGVFVGAPAGSSSRDRDLSAPSGTAGSGLRLAFPASRAAVPSPSSRMTAIGVLTATSLVPSGTRILPRVPSSTASTSMVALSVSISAITSPDLTASPSFLCHLARLPFSMVGESAGISTSIGMEASPVDRLRRFPAKWTPVRRIKRSSNNLSGFRFQRNGTASSGRPARDWSPPTSPPPRASDRRRRRRAPC